MLQVLGRHIIRVGYGDDDNDVLKMMKLMMRLTRETMRLRMILMVLLLLLLLIVGFSVILINITINFIISIVSSHGKLIMRFPLSNHMLHFSSQDEHLQWNAISEE